MTSRQLGVMVVALAVIVWAVPFQVAPVWADVVITDIPVYREAADRVLDGAVPYRDFALEYPPGALLVFLAPALVPIGYGEAFSVLMLAALVATALGAMATARALGLDRRREAFAGIAIAVSPLLLGNLVETRFDLVPTALVAWTLWAAARGRMRLAWALLGAAALVKLFPLALVPALAVYHLRRSGVRATLRGAAGGLAVFAAGLIPFVALSLSGTWDLVQYHLDRPPQIESTASAYLLSLHALANVPVAVENSFGSQGIPGSAAATIATATTAAALVAVVAILVTFRSALRGARPPGDARLLVAASAATLAALLAGGKVLSPQFLVWLLPVGFLIAGRFAWAAAGGTVLALLLTQAYFPSSYWDLVALDGPQIWTLVLRNAVIIALVAAYWPRPSVATRAEGRVLWWLPRERPPRAESAVAARYLTD